MSHRTGHGPPLLVVWSPSKVRIYDPVTKQNLEGTRLGDCLNGRFVGREAIFAVAQRNAFIRVVPVPSVGRDEIEKLLPFKLGQVLPLGPSETVSGFRLARSGDGVGHKAVVGAMKTELLRKIHEDAQASGLRVHTVVPLAFGSWLVAKEKALATCAVVEAREDGLAIDVVADGELHYSRSVPLPDSQAEIDDEIAATFEIARVEPGPVIAAGTPGLHADLEDRRHPIEHLSDSRNLDRLLFTLELPEKARARQARIERRAAVRALGALVVAVGLGLYALQLQLAQRAESSGLTVTQGAQVRKALVAQNEAENLRDRLLSAQSILDRAMTPAQTHGDVVAAMASVAPKGVWLTGLTLDRGEPFLIRGNAMDGKMVARFVENLSKEKRFRDVRLVSASKGVIGEKTVVQFGISGRAVGNLPIVEAAQ